MDFHTHPPPSLVVFFTGPLDWNFPQPSCITGAFCLWLELRPPGGKFIASSRWSVAIKIKPAILHPATLHSTIRSPPLWLKLPALSAEIRQANSTHISNGCPTVICGNCPAVQLSNCPAVHLVDRPSALGLGYLIALAISAAFHSDRSIGG